MKLPLPKLYFLRNYFNKWNNGNMKREEKVTIYYTYILLLSALFAPLIRSANSVKKTSEGYAETVYTFFFEATRKTDASLIDNLFAWHPAFKLFPIALIITIILALLIAWNNSHRIKKLTKRLTGIHIDNSFINFLCIAMIATILLALGAFVDMVHPNHSTITLAIGGYAFLGGVLLIGMVRHLWMIIQKLKNRSHDARSGPIIHTPITEEYIEKVTSQSKGDSLFGGLLRKGAHPGKEGEETQENQDNGEENNEEDSDVK